MKAAKIIFLSIAGLLVIAVLGLVIFIKTFDLNRYLPQITKAASDAIGKPVTIGRADLNLSLQGLALDVTDIKVGDDLFSAAKAHAQASFMAFLTRRTIEVSAIDITRIAVNVPDPKMPVHIRIPELHAQVKDISLTEPFPATVDLMFASSKRNVHISVNIRIDAGHSKALISDLAVKSDLSQLDMDEIRAITPVLGIAPLPVSVSGMLNVTAPPFEAGAAGLTGFNARVEITNGGLVMKEILTPVTDLHALAEVDLSDVRLKELTLRIGAGTVKADGTLKDYLKTAQLNAKTNISGVKIEELADTSKMPVGLKGKLNGDVSISGSGLDPQVFLKSLKGQGQMEITEGVIERLNILQAILGSVMGKVPGLAQGLDDMLLGSLKNKMGENSTVLEKATAKFSIADEIVNVEDALAQTKAFDINAKGTIGFNRNVDIAVTALMAQDLSTDVAAKVSALGYLRDENQRIKITGQVTGTAPKVKFIPSPDVKNAAQNAIVEEGSKQLQKVLQKNPEVGDLLNAVLGAAQKQEGDSPDKKEKNKKALSDALNSLFK